MPRLFPVLLAILTWMLPSPATAADPAPPPDLLRPVGGALVRPFDAPRQRWSAGHRGADLSARPGEAVLASADGVVAFVGRVVDREVVSISHAGGYRTTHEPVRAVVRVGQRVRAGDLIGHLMAGDECPSGCLHWGLKRGDDYLDPMSWLVATGIRLLPEGLELPPPPPAATGGLLRELEATDLPASSYGLVRPSSGPVTSRFGPRFHPVLHVWKLHDGLDFGAPCGAPVRSAAAGRVVLVEANIAYGNRVVVEHGSVGGRRMRTSYNHLSSIGVGLGQAVRQGASVGRVGTTGYSTGCHLHFMVWADGQVSNPAGWVS